MYNYDETAMEQNQVQRPPQALKPSPADNGVTKEGAQQIIRRRKRGSVTAMGIVCLVAFGMGLLDRTISIGILVISAAIIFSIFALTYIINSLNYPEPQPWYRSWNKIVYIYAAKLVIIGSIFNIGSSAGRATDMAGDVGTIYVVGRNLKPADYIEAFYRQQAAQKQVS